MIPETEPEESWSDPSTQKSPRLHLAYPETRSISLSPGARGVSLDRAFFETTLGIANPTASSAGHARIDQPNATIRIVDAGGKNGTWVNGARLAESEAVTLTEGTVIRIGNAVFVYRERSHLLDQPERRPFHEIVGRPAEHVFVGPFTLPSLARRIDSLRIEAAHRSRVLIEGATGTGKEAVAWWIGEALRPGKRFVSCNAARLTDGMADAELYGHERGAYTGSVGEKRGYFEQAEGGTLFFDEIGDLSPKLQASLLRPIQSGEIERVGAGGVVRRTNVLVIGASSVLAERVEAGAFRRDLLARLAEAVVPIPPLAERREDIGALVVHLLARRHVGTTIEAAAIEALMIHEWKGNVRELASAVDEAVRTSGKLTKSSLPKRVIETQARPSGSFTRNTANEVYRRLGSDAQRAANHLGTTRPTLERILKASRSADRK